MSAIIERNRQTGRFQRVTPASVATRLSERREAQNKRQREAQERARRTAAQRHGYRGPLTRTELTNGLGVER
jgi:hypothetical protein